MCWLSETLRKICNAGVVVLLERMGMNFGTHPLTVEHLDDALRMLVAVENDLIRHTVAEVKDAVLIEQCLIELDEMREAA